MARDVRLQRGSAIAFNQHKSGTSLRVFINSRACSPLVKGRCGGVRNRHRASYAASFVRTVHTGGSKQNESCQGSRRSHPSRYRHQWRLTWSCDAVCSPPQHVLKQWGCSSGCSRTPRCYANAEDRLPLPGCPGSPVPSVSLHGSSTLETPELSDQHMAFPSTIRKPQSRRDQQDGRRRRQSPLGDRWFP